MLLPDIDQQELARRIEVFSAFIGKELPIVDAQIMNSDGYFYEIEGAGGHGVVYSGFELRTKTEAEMFALLRRRIGEIRSRCERLAAEALVEEKRLQDIEEKIDKQLKTHFCV